MSKVFPTLADWAATAFAAPDDALWRLQEDGYQAALEASQTLTHGRTIDMWRGVLRAEWRQRDPAGRVVRLRTLRFVSLANRALAVQVVWIAVVQPTPLALEAW